MSRGRSWWLPWRSLWWPVPAACLFFVLRSSTSRWPYAILTGAVVGCSLAGGSGGGADGGVGDGNVAAVQAPALSLILQFAGEGRGIRPQRAFVLEHATGALAVVATPDALAATLTRYAGLEYRDVYFVRDDVVIDALGGQRVTAYASAEAAGSSSARSGATSTPANSVGRGAQALSVTEFEPRSAVGDVAAKRPGILDGFGLRDDVLQAEPRARIVDVLSTLREGMRGITDVTEPLRPAIDLRGAVDVHALEPSIVRPPSLVGAEPRFKLVDLAEPSKLDAGKFDTAARNFDLLLDPRGWAKTVLDISAIRPLREWLPGLRDLIATRGIVPTRDIDFRRLGELLNVRKLLESSYSKSSSTKASESPENQVERRAPLRKLLVALGLLSFLGVASAGAAALPEAHNPLAALGPLFDGLKSGVAHATADRTALGYVEGTFHDGSKRIIGGFGVVRIPGVDHAVGLTAGHVITKNGGGKYQAIEYVLPNVGWRSAARSTLVLQGADAASSNLQAPGPSAPLAPAGRTQALETARADVAVVEFDRALDGRVTPYELSAHALGGAPSPQALTVAGYGYTYVKLAWHGATFDVLESTTSGGQAHVTSHTPRQRPTTPLGAIETSASAPLCLGDSGALLVDEAAHVAVGLLSAIVSPQPNAAEFCSAQNTYIFVDLGAQHGAIVTSAQ